MRRTAAVRQKKIRSRVRFPKNFIAFEKKFFTEKKNCMTRERQTDRTNAKIQEVIQLWTRDLISLSQKKEKKKKKKKKAYIKTKQLS